MYTSAEQVCDPPQADTSYILYSVFCLLTSSLCRKKKAILQEDGLFLKPNINEKRYLTSLRVRSSPSWVNTLRA